MSWVWDHSPTTGSDRLVLLAIADSADHDGTNAWPSVATIGKKTRLSEATVHRCIGRLKKDGAITVEPQAGGTAAMRADRRPNLYGVVMATGSQSDTPDGVSPGAATGSHPARDGVSPVTPNPSLDPSDEQPPPSTDVDKDRGFDVFWEAYPKRNGKRLGKAKALTRWRALALDTKRRAYAATVHYAAAVDSGATIAKDPERFLANAYFEDWADGPGDTPKAKVVGIADRPPEIRADGARFVPGSGWIVPVGRAADG